MDKDVEAYFAGFPKEIRERLGVVRRVFLEEAPDASEGLRYRMPTILWNGNLIHYAAFKNHIGIYPLPQVLAEMGDEISGYKTGKGSIQFRHDEELPVELIREIVKRRKAEKERELAAKKGSPRKKAR